MSTRTEHKPRVPADSPDPEQAREIGRKSPEGVPAHPETGPRTIGLMLALSVIGLLTAGILVAVLIAPIIGVALGGLGLVLLLVNPTVWSAILRAEERSEIESDDQHPNR